MRKVIGALAALAVMTHASAASAGGISVKIIGIDSSKGGHIRIGLFARANAKKFPADEAIGTTRPANKPSVTVKFPDIFKPGEYAIAVVHDENNNAKLDTNLFGVPREGLGFSGNAQARLGAPKFMDAAFKVKSKGNTPVSIKLKY